MMKPDVRFVQLDDAWRPRRGSPTPMYRGEARIGATAIERVTGEVLRPGRRLVRIEEWADGAYHWTTRGHSMLPGGGTRYHYADSLSEAQDRILRWAGRRFAAAPELGS